MENLVEFNKEGLIKELKELHKELVDVYLKLFVEKYSNESNFKGFVDNEYKENGISEKDKKGWSEKFCQKASYTLINKILFIKICEDKEFMLGEEDRFSTGEIKNPNAGKKLSNIGYQKWTNLVTNYTLSELMQLAFRDMSVSYPNIVLYKHDKYEKLNPQKEEIEQKFKLSENQYNETSAYEFERVINDIIYKLDKPEYNFGLDEKGNVLGDVYEKFLDRETRKALGQFYTPDFVIEYIIENSVKNVDVVENPFVKILDPSCGSGHFLNFSYDILRKKFEENIDILKSKYATEQYLIKRNGEIKQITGSEYWVPENVHFHILKNCIFGADIDDFAVQLTTISLLLKDFNHITDELNIIKCDSLIQWEKDYEWAKLQEQLDNINLYYSVKYKDLSGTEQEEIISREKADEIAKICKFWSQKFDYIVGNPPYGSEVKSEVLKQYYMKNYSDVHMRTIDVYNYFISRIGKKLNKESGLIIPNTILTQYEYTNCRKYLLDNFNISSLINLGENVFEDNTYPTVIVTFETREESSEVCNKPAMLLDASGCSDNLEKQDKLRQIQQICIRTNPKTFLDIDQYKFLLIEEELVKLLFKIKSSYLSLNEISKFVSVGIASGNDKAFLINDKNRSLIDERLLKKVLVGGNINKYSINYSNQFILYIDRNTDVIGCDKTLNYLSKYKEQLSSRREATKGIIRWFELHWPRNKDLFENVKILCRQTGDSLIATLDDNKYYTLNSIINIALKESVYDCFTEEYIVALLNSKLMNVYYQLLVQENSKLFAEVKPVVLKELPIPKVGKERLDIIKRKVNEIIYLNNEINKLRFSLSGDIISNYINYIDKVYDAKAMIEENELYLNKFIYEIFSLEQREIEIIETLFCKKNKVERFREDINSKVLSFNTLIKEHIEVNMSMEDICKLYNVSLRNCIELRKKYFNEYSKEEPWKVYNITELYNEISKYIADKAINVLSELGKFAMQQDIYNLLKEKITNIEQLIEIIRIKDPSKKAVDIIKDSISLYSDTWNTFTKNKDNEKSIKEIVRYENGVYGLSNWSDEIHKEYFFNIINEYTINKPNKKKAETVLKIIKQLDIEDKEAYVNEIEKSIKKTFS